MSEIKYEKMEGRQDEYKLAAASQYFDKGTRELSMLLRENYKLKTDIRILENQLKDFARERIEFEEEKKRLEKWDEKLKRIAEEIHTRN